MYNVLLLAFILWYSAIAYLTFLVTFTAILFLRFIIFICISLRHYFTFIKHGSRWTSSLKKLINFHLKWINNCIPKLTSFVLVKKFYKLTCPKVIYASKAKKLKKFCDF